MGASPLLTLMSGDYVQRGEPAIVDRYTRAHMAVLGGADLVLAYPSRWATGSAERFAEYAVRILDGLGVVEQLVFGSECGEIEPLLACAGALAEEEPAYREALKAGLREGLSFPKARAQALPEFAELLRRPNNILGVEYCKALLRLRSRIRPVTVRRVGAAHEDAAPGTLPSSESPAFASAAALRQMLMEVPVPSSSEAGEKLRWEDFVPPVAAERLRRELARSAPMSAEDLVPLLRAVLWASDDPQALTRGLDVTRDLARTFIRERGHLTGWDAFAERCASRSVTKTHVSRALLHLCLDIRAEGEEESGTADPGLVTQVLGLREEAAPFLGEIRRRTSIPVVINPVTDRQALAGRAAEVFREEVRVTNLYEAIRAGKSGREAVHCFSQGLVRG